MTSNVYYLPAPVVVTEPPRLSPGLRVRLYALTLWFRARITATEVADALRRFGRPAPDADAIFLDQPADLLLAPARPRSPARIVDLAAARARLRA
jgi:hypothetical protein